MTFKPDEIKNNLVGGGARVSQFEVIITSPLILDAAAKITALCTAASLPPSELGMIPVSYFGRKIKLAGDRVFPDWTITIINDEDFIVRRAFERWSALINGHSTNLRNTPGGPGPNSYKSRAQIIQYGKAGDILQVYDMEGCYPQAISAIETNWATSDAIEEFQVTLAYDYWVTAGLPG